MNIFRTCLFSAAGVLLLCGTNSVWAAKAEVFPPDIPEAAVEDVSDRNYYQKLRELIMGAEQSIDISAENIAMEEGPDDPAAVLVEDLIRAQKRKVPVRLFLNTFSEAAEETPFFLREDVLYRMRREGVEIHFVNPGYRLLDRLMIIDQRKVLEGGVSWNKKDFENSLLSAVLIHSSQLAGKKRARLEFLPLWDVEQHKKELTQGGIPVPFYLLRDIKYFPSMVRNDDGDAMKIYFALLQIFHHVQDVHLTASFDELAREIPAENYYEKSALQFQVLKTLDRLATEYGLIEIEKKAVDRYQIRMIFPSDNEPVIRVPQIFFQENYAKELSEEGLFSYLVILYRSQISGEAPIWLGSERNIEQDFPMAKEKFRMGVSELREKNLIEVFPFKLQGGYKLLESMEYRYLLNPILSQAERLGIWSRLRDQYGDDSFKKAQSMAAALGEPEDPKVLTVYMDLMKRFKSEDVLAFTERLSSLPPESTPELLTYLRTLLEHETQKNVQLGTS